MSLITEDAIADKPQLELYYALLKLECVCETLGEQKSDNARTKLINSLGSHFKLILFNMMKYVVYKTRGNQAAAIVKAFNSAAQQQQQRATSNRTTLEDFAWFFPSNSSWMDNDSFGHINNATYCSMMESAIDSFYTAECGQSVSSSYGDRRPFTASMSCKFIRQACFPAVFMIGLSADWLSEKRVKFHSGVFPMDASIDSIRPCAGYALRDLPMSLVSPEPVCVGFLEQVFHEEDEIDEQICEGLAKLRIDK